MGPLQSRTKLDICLVGIGNGGQTTALAQWTKFTTEIDKMIPTIGFNIETYRNIPGFEFKLIDIGGNMLGRRLLNVTYCKQSHGIIFFIDSTDYHSLKDAKEELHRLLAHPDMNTSNKTAQSDESTSSDGNNSKNLQQPTMLCPVLILANKQDDPNALPLNMISEKLELEELKQKYPKRRFGIMKAVAKKEMTDEPLKFFI